jgi:hypothetical protein
LKLFTSFLSASNVVRLPFYCYECINYDLFVFLSRLIGLIWEYVNVIETFVDDKLLITISNFNTISFRITQNS